jgi:hypothetical protein
MCPVIAFWKSQFSRQAGTRASGATQMAQTATPNAMLAGQWGARVGSAPREKKKIAATRIASRSSSFVGFAMGTYLSTASQSRNTANGPTHVSVRSGAPDMR